MARASGRGTRTVTAGVAVALALALGAAPAGAQAPDTEPEAPNQLDLVKVDNSDYPTLDVVVSVPLPEGQPPLPESAYDVLVGSTSRDFSATYLGSDGVELAVVVDAGTPAQLQVVQEVAAALLRRLPAGTSVTLVQSGAEPTVVAPLTDDLAQVDAALGSLSPADPRSTSEAVTAGLDELSGAESTRGSVVVVTADPQGDGRAAARTAVAASRRQIPIHVMAVGVGDMPPVVNPYRLTGGVRIVAEAPEGFVPSLDEVAALSSGHYRLVFTVQRATPERVMVRVAAEGISGEQEVSVEPPPGALRTSGNRRRGPAGQVANQLFPVTPVAAAAAGALIVFLGAYWRRRRRGSWG